MLHCGSENRNGQTVRFLSPCNEKSEHFNRRRNCEQECNTATKCKTQRSLVQLARIQRQTRM